MHRAREILYAMDGAAKDHWTTEGYSVIEVESPLETDTVRRVANLQAGLRLRNRLIPQCGSSSQVACGHKCFDEYVFGCAQESSEFVSSSSDDSDGSDNKSLFSTGSDSSRGATWSGSDDNIDGAATFGAGGIKPHANLRAPRPPPRPPPRVGTRSSRKSGTSCLEVTNIF